MAVCWMMDKRRACFSLPAALGWQSLGFEVGCWERNGLWVHTRVVGMLCRMGLCLRALGLHPHAQKPTIHPQILLGMIHGG